MELREYQTKAIARILEEFETHHRVCLQLPTGAGKTNVFIRVIEKVYDYKRPVLVLAHRSELLTQAEERINLISGLNSFVLKPGVKHIKSGTDIIIGSVQTLCRRNIQKLSPEGFSLVVIDEAHRTITPSYLKVLNQLAKDTPVLGVTATPQRTDGVGLEGFYTTLVKDITDIPSLTRMGYLSEFELYAHPCLSEADKKVDLLSSAKVISKIYNTPELNEKLFTLWKDKASELKTLVYCVDIAHARDYANTLVGNGVKAHCISSKTPKNQRKQLLRDFTSGEIQVLVNVELFTEGFDCPGIECIQVIRPTQSFGLWLQMLGRGLRPDGGICLILDHTTNSDRLGSPSELFSWHLRHSRWSLDYSYSCPECGHTHLMYKFDLLVESGLTPEYIEAIRSFKPSHPCHNCGYHTPLEFDFRVPGTKSEQGEIFSQGDTDPDSFELTLLSDSYSGELNPTITTLINDIRQDQLDSGYKSGWCWYALCDHLKDKPELLPLVTIKELRYMARMLSYKPGWEKHRIIDIYRL